MQDHLSTEQLLQRFQRGEKVFENIHRISGPSLEGADLSGITLRDVCLHEVSLSGTNLSGAYLEHVTIEFAGLERTNLTNAILRDVTISHTQLPGVIFQGANLQQVTFHSSSFDKNIDLRHANLSYATLVGVQLSNANLFGANLTAAYLSDVDFSGADLRQVLVGHTTQERITRDATTLWEPIVLPDPQALRTRSRKTGSVVSAASLPSTELVTIPGEQGGIPLEQAKRQVLFMLQQRFSRAGRKGQARFRADLFSTYKGRCAITGCGLEPILEAAHIYPHCLWENNHPTNGILLRNDLHALFDWNLLKIDPETRQVLIDPSIKEEMYRSLHGTVIAVPFQFDSSNRSWIRMLQWRWKEYGHLVAGFNPKHRYIKGS